MSTFGEYFRVTTFGESHGSAIGCIVDGIPPRMPLSVERDIQPQSDRRKPGQSLLTTPRAEKDMVHILSGIEHGYTLGTPISMIIYNEDARPDDYREKNRETSYASFSQAPRPSHADWTYQCKYGVHAATGGGRSSARETAARVAAGSLAEAWLAHRFNLEIVAFVHQVGHISLTDYISEVTSAPSVKVIELERYIHQHLVPELTRSQVDSNDMRTIPNFNTMVADMTNFILKAKGRGDSVGGGITCIVRCRSVPGRLPVGLGEPCFDKLQAKLAHAMMSLPAARSFELGSGYGGCCDLPGSSHNDPFQWTTDQPPILHTSTNHSGGIQGGISNGEPIIFRVGFKAPSSINVIQRTAGYDLQQVALQGQGRHDPCVLSRAVPLVEAMAALVIADAAMAQLARCSASNTFEIPWKCDDGDKMKGILLKQHQL